MPIDVLLGNLSVSGGFRSDDSIQMFTMDDQLLTKLCFPGKNMPTANFHFCCSALECRVETGHQFPPVDHFRVPSLIDRR